MLKKKYMFNFRCVNLEHNTIINIFKIFMESVTDENYNLTRVLAFVATY